MFTIMGFIVLGMVAGWVASLLVRGEKHPRDWGLLFIVGVGGALIGGIVVNLLAGNGLQFKPGGLHRLHRGGMPPAVAHHTRAEQDAAAPTHDRERYTPRAQGRAAAPQAPLDRRQ